MTQGNVSRAAITPIIATRPRSAKALPEWVCSLFMGQKLLSGPEHVHILYTDVDTLTAPCSVVHGCVWVCKAEGLVFIGFVQRYHQGSRPYSTCVYRTVHAHTACYICY